MRVPSPKTNRNPGPRRAVVLAVALLATLAVLGAPASAHVPAGVSWTADLTPDGDDMGVRATDGELRLDPATAVRWARTESPRLQGTLLTAQRAPVSYTHLTLPTTPYV